MPVNGIDVGSGIATGFGPLLCAVGPNVTGRKQGRAARRVGGCIGSTHTHRFAESLWGQRSMANRDHRPYHPGRRAGTVVT
jgi:hypothetical protein